jgi:hypothetical protein
VILKTCVNLKVIKLFFIKIIFNSSQLHSSLSSLHAKPQLSIHMELMLMDHMLPIQLSMLAQLHQSPNIHHTQLPMLLLLQLQSHTLPMLPLQPSLLPQLHLLTAIMLMLQSLLLKPLLHTQLPTVDPFTQPLSQDMPSHKLASTWLQHQELCK